ncbi:carbohydrate esterase family 12 protein [Moniliophthora roreri]|nr:carbohydrate esterase family 12 protein [Moniliophthora roreri]
MAQDLAKMVEDIRGLGAEPVLVSSLVIRDFRANGKINDVLAPWVNVTTNMAKVLCLSSVTVPTHIDVYVSYIYQEQKTHYIDLHGASLKHCEAIGANAAHRLNDGPSDTTPYQCQWYGRFQKICMPSVFRTICKY